MHSDDPEDKPNRNDCILVQLNIQREMFVNPKERITVALEGGIPDRVPVTLGLSEMVPVRFFTDNYIDFFWKERIPLWKARVETEFDRFGADSFIHLSENPSVYDPPGELSDVKELDEQGNAV